jgi:hypothetical protein
MVYRLRTSPWPSGVTVAVFRDQDVDDDGVTSGPNVATGVVSAVPGDSSIEFPAFTKPLDWPEGYGLLPGTAYAACGSGAVVRFTTQDTPEPHYWH